MLSTIATSESRTGSTSIAPRRKEAVCVTSPRLSQGPDHGLAGTGLLLMGNLDWRKWLRYWSNTHSSDQMREETFDESRQAIDSAPRDSGHNRNRGESRGGSHVQFCRGKQPVRRGSLRQAAEPAGEPVLLAQ